MPGPVVNVNPTTCTTNPPGEVHAPGKSQNGFVVFNTTEPCTILFSGFGVFKRSSAQLSMGSNRLDVETEDDHTLVTIAGCGDKVPRSVGAAGNPTDIIVP
jgi:hypothetical protein